MGGSHRCLESGVYSAKPTDAVVLAWMGRMVRRSWFRAWLMNVHLGVHLLVLVVLLGLPSLWLGLQLDDYIHKASLIGVEQFPEASRSWWNLFDFIHGNPAINQRYIEGGVLPWWSSPDLRLAFFRPVTGLTHWLDYRLWPNKPVMMHVHSLVWYAAAVVVMTRFYRSVASVALAAGIGALVFAIDDSHGMPLVWLANRNSIVGLFFAAVSLLAHVRWRRGGSRWQGWLSAFALLLALLAFEGAVATCAYVLAYALFIEHGAVPKRVRGLLPAAAVTAVWLVAYKLLGYGASGSGMYIDPLTDPLRYLGAAAERAPLLLWGQWAWPPSDMHNILSEPAARMMWFVAVALAAVLACVLLTPIRRNRVARFWAGGMLLSIPPVCVTVASDRLLMFVGIGGAGLLAEFLAETRRPISSEVPYRLPNSITRIAAGTLVIVHMFLAPLGLLAASLSVKSFGVLLDQSVRSLPSDESLANQDIIIVQAPSAFLSALGPVILAMDGRPVPRRLLALGSSIYPIELERSGLSTLVLRPEGGFLPPPGGPHPGEADGHPVFHPLYVLTQFDHLYRDVGRPFSKDERIELAGVTAHVTRLTQDDRPAEVTFEFDHPLEDPRYRWVFWRDGAYVPFELPAIGETRLLRLKHSAPLP